MKRALAVTAGLAALCLVGCESGTDVSGTWNLRDARGNSGTLTLRQLGSTVTGNLQGYGYSVPLSGSLDGNTLRLGVSAEHHDIQLVATVSGDSMQGAISDTVTGHRVSITGTRTSKAGFYPW